MSNTHSPSTPDASSPFGSKQLGAAMSDEESPLLQREGSEQRRGLFRTAASAFVDRNAGLLLVVASQFFFAATNSTVKWLNSLDEPVPILEVRGVQL